jgi:opacity protein-like surface antigen
MTKSVCVLAVLAAAVSTSAVAKDLKQNKQAPAVSATQMTDSEMDRVTGGAATNVFIVPPNTITKVVGTDGHNGYVHGNAQNTHNHFKGF